MKTVRSERTRARRQADRDQLQAADAEFMSWQKRSQQAACPHGEPAGDQLRPLTGKAMCPKCRRGLPADSDESDAP